MRTLPAPKVGLLASSAALAFAALLFVTGCPGNSGNDGGTGGSGGGDVGGGAGGGGGGGGGDGGMDSGTPDAGTCAKVTLAASDATVKLSSAASGTFWAALGTDGLDVVRYSGGNFSASTRLADGGTLLEHALAAGDGDALLAWIQSAGAGGEVHYGRFDGNSWSTSTPTTRSQVPSGPQLANAGSRGLLIWNEGPQQTAQLEYQRYVSNAWSAVARLDVGDGGVSIGSAAADQTGPIAFWGGPAPDAGFRLWAGEVPATGSPTVINSVHGGYALISAGNKMGQAMVISQQGDTTIYARRWVRGSGFTDESQPTLNTTNGLASLVLLDDGTAYATWTDATNKAVGASAPSGTSPTWTPFLVPDDPAALVAGDGTRVALASIANGKVHFSWHDANGWSTPLELPTGVQASSLDGLAITGAGELALTLTGTAGGGAASKFAVVCH